MVSSGSDGFSYGIANNGNVMIDQRKWLQNKYLKKKSISVMNDLGPYFSLACSAQSEFDTLNFDLTMDSGNYSIHDTEVSYRKERSVQGVNGLGLFEIRYDEKWWDADTDLVTKKQLQEIQSEDTQTTIDLKNFLSAADQIVTNNVFKDQKTEKMKLWECIF